MGCLGGFRRMFHWGPLLALAIITTISMCTMMCTLQWWPVSSGVGGVVNLFIYLIWNVTTFYNFFNAMFVGPGHVPFGWEPENKEDTKYLQRCTFCEGCKAPRSHHCRKCSRCVMKMDHHCPWINNCVGHRNHAYFTYFLFYAPCGCIHSCLILIPSMYRALYRHHYLIYGSEGVPIVNLSINKFIMCMFSVGLAVGVIVAVGSLFFIQIRAILRNETGIEGWIKEKAKYREREEGEEGEFVYPYDLGRWENWRMVLHIKRRPELTGFWWPVREGCNQFTLTVEQMKQKREKKERSVLYLVQEQFSGATCPLTKGVKVFCCPPCTDEPRIKLELGDQILVSRWKKHWLYGDKVLTASVTKTKALRRVRGWFPRKCVVEVIDNGSVCDGHSKESGDKKDD